MIVAPTTWLRSPAGSTTAPQSKAVTDVGEGEARDQGGAQQGRHPQHAKLHPLTRAVQPTVRIP
jgi:hypothetical protein